MDKKLWTADVVGDFTTRSVQLSGELDLDGAEELYDLVVSQLETARMTVLDMSAVTFIDSTALTALLRAYDRAGLMRNRDLLLVNLSRQVQRAFDIAGLTGIFAVVDRPAGSVPAA
jgi:anti-sigma B factor antagonist